MLEDALRRNSSSKDVGRRRSSRDTTSQPVQEVHTQSQRASLEEGHEYRKGSNAPELDSPSLSAMTPTTSPSQDSRFFRFRFTSGRTTPTQSNSPDLGNQPLPNGLRSPNSALVGHLTSASLPSLLPPQSHEKELEQLRAKLEDEKLKFEKIAADKKNLESELESLSQALFEEVSPESTSVELYLTLSCDGTLSIWGIPL